MRIYFRIYIEFVVLVVFLGVNAGFVIGQSDLVAVDQMNEREKRVNIFCRILSDPEKFLNGEHEIEAVYISGMETAWLASPTTCSEEPDPNKRIVYNLDASFSLRSDRKSLKRFNKIIKTLKNPRKVRGKFIIRVETYQKENPLDTRYKFQIEILAVVSVSKAEGESRRRK